MADVRDVVTDALREIGVLAAGETATADDAISGLAAINRLIDQWAAERLMIYQETRTTFTIAASTQTYTVGTGATVNVARPVFLQHVRFSDSSASTPSEISLTELTDDAWALVTQKTMTSAYPSCYWYSRTYPNALLYLWPVPTSSTLTGIIYAPQQVSEFTSLNTAISLPPGYRRMLVKNLALEMCPSYEREPSQALVMHAIESKAVVKRGNTRMMDLGFEPGALVQGQSRYAYNINTD